jgi:dihydrofolate reductase
MIISAIAAIAKNNVIGYNNDIPWNMPKDMKFFMRTTTGHHIIMGRKNFESLGRPLPRRTNIVITRNPFYISTGCIIVHSLEEALSVAKENGEEEVFIIGGGIVYDQAMDYLDKIYLTEIDIEVEGDVFFPQVDETIWKETSVEFSPADEKNKADMVFKVFERR